MYRLVVTPDFKEEIAALRATDIDAAAAALFLLEELADDQETLEVLCLPRDHFSYNPSFEVKVFRQAAADGYNIYILKFRDFEDRLPSCRILIGFDAQRSTYYALSIPHRSESYSPGGTAYRVLRDRYEQHGLPTYPRSGRR